MTAPRSNMHCDNPLCVDDECRGECELTHHESRGGRLCHGNDEPTVPRQDGYVRGEFYCED